MAVLVLGFVGLSLLGGAVVADSRGGKIAAGVVGGILVLACAFVAISEYVLSRGADEVWTVDDTTALASLANASEVEGSGGMFVSRVEEKNVLRYVEARDDGGFELKEIDADGVTIYEDADKDSARIDVESCHREGVDPDSLSYSCGTRTRVHVPKGTVSTDFEVDPGK